MVVGGASRARPAFVVPDRQSWAVWGHDLARIRAADGAMVAPARVPAALADAVGTAWRALPEPRRALELSSPLTDGVPLSKVIAAAPRADAGAGGGHEEMTDPMEVSGDPSSDGLVMEAIELTLGPLSAALPGGLIAELTLDGDVVAACTLRTTLTHASGAPDPWAPRAATGAGPAAVALERALSHAARLHQFAAVLGWADLRDRAARAVAGLLAAEDGASPAALASARRRVERLAELLTDSRRLAARLRGRGVVSGEEAAGRGLAGPNARASADGAGDAESRTIVRAREALAAVALAEGLARGAAASGSLDASLEGPRGPAGAMGAAAAALGLAADLAVGQEWSDALAVIVSFDLSPWRQA